MTSATQEWEVSRESSTGVSLLEKLSLIVRAGCMVEQVMPTLPND
jgi:hypothetical protein